MRPPWEEGTEPTPEQLADWMLACDSEERLRLARVAVAASQAAFQCMASDHESLRYELDATRENLLQSLRRERRFRLAWLSARRFRRSFRSMTARLDRGESFRDILAELPARPPTQPLLADPLVEKERRRQ